jgi:hypothetical protein
MDKDMDISMDIHEKSVDMDMDVEYHIHGNPSFNANDDGDCAKSIRSRVPSFETERHAKDMRRHATELQQQTSRRLKQRENHPQ